MKNVLEMLETDAIKFADKTAFDDENSSLSYKDLINKSKAIGSFLIDQGIVKKPIAIFINQSVKVPVSMFGIIYSGNYYCVLDSKSPAERIYEIFSSLKPAAVITDNDSFATGAEIFDLPVFLYEDICNEPINDLSLSKIRNNQIDTDPIYALFTSGSTGKPKGAILNHNNVLKYSKWLTETFNYNENTKLGNQTPFYFSMSVSDIYGTLRVEGTVHIIPKKHFSFPLNLLKYLNEKRINTIYWVPSALSIVANWKALDYVELPYIKKVLFAGEVMPTKQLNIWIEKLPEDVLFANLFGPTETTDICCYYVVNRKLDDFESVPIGNHCDNCDCLIIKEDGTEAKQGEEGELMVRGSFVAAGYYNNPELTEKAFCQNPLNNSYPEIVYKTGDIVKLNELGEMIYVSRKDFQIKRHGYRIELGEIETAVSGIDRINYCACVYDDDNDEIVLVYQGVKVDRDYIFKHISDKLPTYMHPDKIVKISNMPFNANGKIDRKYLKSSYKKGELK